MTQWLGMDGQDSPLNHTPFVLEFSPRCSNQPVLAPLPTSISPSPCRSTLPSKPCLTRGVLAC